MGSLVFRIAGSGGGGTCADGSWVTGKVGSYALQFGGEDSGDYVAIPVGASATDGLTSWATSGSVAAWIYPTNYDNAETIFFHGDDQWDADWARFLLDPTDGRLRYGHRVNNQATWYYSSDAVPLNQWSHIAMTANGTGDEHPAYGIKFYINGTQSATTGGRTDFSNWINDLHGAKGHALSSIGRHVGNPSGWGYTQAEFAGKIDEFGIWTEVVNLGGMQTLYNGGDGAACSTVSSSYLQAYYNMEEGAGNSTLTDRTGNGHTGTLAGMDTGSC